DLPSQLEVALAEPIVVGCDGDQPHDHPVVPHVNVRVVVIEIRQLADGVYEAYAGRERPGSEVRARSFPHHAPILDALGLAELPHGDLVAHGLPFTVESANVRRL